MVSNLGTIPFPLISAEGRVTDGFLHVVSSAFYSGIFEVVIHDMPMEEAKNYINELRAFYGNGWKEYYRK